MFFYHFSLIEKQNKTFFFIMLKLLFISYMLYQLVNKALETRMLCVFIETNLFNFL